MKNPSKSFIHNAMFCRWAASGSSTTSWEHSPKTSHRVAVLLCFPNVLHFHLHIQDLREVTCSSATRFWWVQQEAEKLKSHTFLGILKVNSFSGCLRHYLRKEKNMCQVLPVSQGFPNPLGIQSQDRLYANVQSLHLSQG